MVGKPGVILTPHLGASSAEAEDNCAEMAVREIRNYLENGNIINSVNFPKLDMGAKAHTRYAFILKGVDNPAEYIVDLVSKPLEVAKVMASMRKDGISYVLLETANDDVVELTGLPENVMSVRVI